MSKEEKKINVPSLIGHMQYLKKAFNANMDRLAILDLLNLQ
jgi:hypothetical protein